MTMTNAAPASAACGALPRFAARPEPLPADLAGSVVLLYSGNYGVAHEIDTGSEDDLLLLDRAMVALADGRPAEAEQNEHVHRLLGDR